MHMKKLGYLLNHHYKIVTVNINTVEQRIKSKKLLIHVVTSATYLQNEYCIKTVMFHQIIFK